MNLTVTTFMAKGGDRILYEANSLTLIVGLVVAGVRAIFQWIAGLLAITAVFSV